MKKQLLPAWSKLYTLKLLFFTACVGPEREAMGGGGGSFQPLSLVWESRELPVGFISCEAISVPLIGSNFVKDFCI